MKSVHRTKLSFVLALAVGCLFVFPACHRQETQTTVVPAENQAQCYDISLSEFTSPAGSVTVKSSKENYVINVHSDNKVCINLTGSFDGGVILNNQKNVDIDINFKNVHITSNTNPGFLDLKSNDANKGNIYTIRLIGESEIIGASDKASKNVLESKPNLVLTGDGSLNVVAKYKNGINVDDVLTVSGGSIHVLVDRKEAAANGDYKLKGFAVKAVNGFVMSGGKLTIDGNDEIKNYETRGIKVDGSDKTAYHAGKGNVVISGGELVIRTDTKALSAGWERDEDAKTEDTSDDPNPDVLISGGRIDITTSAEPSGKRFMGPPPDMKDMKFDENGRPVMPEGFQPPPMMGNDEAGGSGDFHRRPSPNRKKMKPKSEGNSSDPRVSPEGIEAKRNLIISGGTVIIRATDDALNAGELIQISGGNIMAWSKSNDAVDCNGKIMISGGTAALFGSSDPEGALDADMDENVAYTGGTIFALGGENNAPKASGTTGSFVAAELVEGKMFGPPSFKADSQDAPSDQMPDMMPGRKREKSELASAILAVASQDDGKLVAAVRVPEEFTGGGRVLVLSNAVKEGTMYRVYTNPTFAQPVSNWINDALTTDDVTVSGEKFSEVSAGTALPKKFGPGAPGESGGPGGFGGPGGRGGFGGHGRPGPDAADNADAPQPSSEEAKPQ